MSNGDDAGMPEERLYEDTILEIFQRKHAIRVLLFMDRAGSAMESEVERNVAKGKITGEILRTFEKVGLVSMRRDKSTNENEHSANIWSVEPKGRGVARKFREAEGIMNGTVYLDEDLDADVNDRDAPEVAFTADGNGDGKRGSRKPL